MSVLSIRGLTVTYATQRPLRAVDGVDLDLDPGEVLGIAGESGCGKSTLAYAVTRLLRPPAQLTAGSVVFRPPSGEPVDVLALSDEALREFRWRRVSMVFQSAMNSLNPVLTVRAQLADVLTTHQPELTRRQTHDRCRELLDLVGIDQRRLSSYPHQLSGGMRQRVTIAMALALRPEIIVMDEPTTALDVVVQREILDEVDRLRRLFGFAVVFITHDLSLLLEISDRIAVMYAGRIVEQAPAASILNGPRHPYTVGLLRSFPSLHGPRQELRGIPGSPPDLAALAPGCAFAPRCPYAFGACRSLTPAPLPVADGTVACHQYDPALAPAGPAEGLRAGLFDPRQQPDLEPQP